MEKIPFHSSWDSVVSAEKKSSTCFVTCFDIVVHFITAKPLRVFESLSTFFLYSKLTIKILSSSRLSAFSTPQPNSLSLSKVVILTTKNMIISFEKNYRFFSFFCAASARFCVKRKFDFVLSLIGFASPFCVAPPIFILNELNLATKIKFERFSSRPILSGRISAPHRPHSSSLASSL